MEDRPKRCRDTGNDGRIETEQQPGKRSNDDREDVNPAHTCPPPHTYRVGRGTCMSRINIFTVVVASLAGLLFGFDTAVISGVTTALRTVFHLGAAGLGLTVAISLL